jgi:hypothetical protein
VTIPCAYQGERGANQYIHVAYHMNRSAHLPSGNHLISDTVRLTYPYPHRKYRVTIPPGDSLARARK